MSFVRGIALDGEQMARTRDELEAHETGALRDQFRNLIDQADRWMEQGPWSVTSKQDLPPSGDMHDYTSQAPYWWPSEDTADGLPYVRRDGERNPEVLRFSDRQYVSKVMRSACVLTMAWFYSRRNEYAQHATNILRTWFLTAGTRMNPHLQHAQMIPGVNTGRPIGIIDFAHRFPSVLDAVALLASDPEATSWSAEDDGAFRTWTAQYLAWLRTSEFGIEESAQENNHGDFACMQKAALALSLGDRTGAAAEVQVMQDRLVEFTDGNGEQRLELARTRSWHYSCFRLAAIVRTAAIGQKLGYDLWQAGVGRLHRAIELLIPYAIGDASWLHDELNFEPHAACDLIRAAAAAGNQMAEHVLKRLPPVPGGDLWLLHPIVETWD